MSKWIEVFRSGITFENPLMRLMIGLCSVLAVSTRIEYSFFLGVAVIFVGVMSNVVVSAFRKLIPSEVRIPIFIVVIASFVTIVDLVMHGFLPGVYAVLGIWIPLIVVNCMILGRAEAFAYNNGVWLSIADGLGKGVGFLIVICMLAAIREVFGAGNLVFLGVHVLSLPAWYQPPSLLVLFPGAFLVFGMLMAGANALELRKRDRGKGVSA